MTLLREALDRRDFIAMAADPVKFVQAFDREPWDYQAATLRRICETEGKDHKFAHRFAVVSWPRQNGKSTVSGWAGLQRLYCADEKQSIITVALDRDSARIILDDARQIIQNSGVLFDLLDPSWGLTKSSIRLKDGSEWKIKSADAVFSRGQRPTMVLFDELGWSSDDGALFQVLSAGMAAAANPLMLITSTVGPIMAGPLWELFQRAEEDDPTVLLLYDTENKSPKITQEFLEGQKQVLPPNIYAREHENKWGEGSDVFCTIEDYNRATSDYDPALERDSGPGYCFTDLGWAHDETAIAIAKPDIEGKTDIVYLKGIRGNSKSPVSLPKVEQLLEHLVKKFGLMEVEIESPQGVGMAQELSMKGIQARVLHPTSKSNSERWGTLYDALKNGKIRLPKDKLLRRQLLTLTIKDSLTGWKVVDVPSIHNDRAVAVAGAYFLAQNFGGEFIFRWVDTFWGQQKPVNKASDQDSGIMLFEAGESIGRAQARLLQEAIDRDFD